MCAGYCLYRCKPIQNATQSSQVPKTVQLMPDFQTVHCFPCFRLPLILYPLALVECRTLNVTSYPSTPPPGSRCGLGMQQVLAVWIARPLKAVKKVQIRRRDHLKSSTLFHISTDLKKLGSFSVLTILCTKHQYCVLQSPNQTSHQVAD